MALFAKKTSIPAQDEALPGRSTPLPISGKHFVNGSNLKQPATGGLEAAIFGLGCFWGAERKFWQIPGVVSTAVGYAGGHTPNATYEEVCSGRTGHTDDEHRRDRRTASAERRHSGVRRIRTLLSGDVFARHERADSGTCLLPGSGVHVSVGQGRDGGAKADQLRSSSELRAQRFEVHPLL